MDHLPMPNYNKLTSKHKKPIGGGMRVRVRDRLITNGVGDSKRSRGY